MTDWPFTLEEIEVVAKKRNNHQSVLQMIADRGDYLLTGAVFCLLLIMMVPLPPFILDILLASSVTVSLLMFITVLVAQRPLDISVFDDRDAAIAWLLQSGER